MTLGTFGNERKIGTHWCINMQLSSRTIAHKNPMKRPIDKYISLTLILAYNQLDHVYIYNFDICSIYWLQLTVKGKLLNWCHAKQPLFVLLVYNYTLDAQSF